MIISTHKKYLFKKFSKKIFSVSSIFLILVVILNLIEEINFLKDTETTIFTPLFLTFLNAPSLLNEMFPFIFLISTQLFFINLYESREIYTFRQFGLDNFSILRYLSLITFFFGVVIIIIFYNFASVCKNQYLKIKNKYTTDNKYLAVITKNGIWIKDNSEDGFVIVNADKIEDNFLINASITKLNKSFQIQKNIIAKKVNIKDYNWILMDTIVTESNNDSKEYKKAIFRSNFNFERINSLFSDLKALTFLELMQLKKDYKIIGYSTEEIDIQSHKFYSLPFLLTMMTLISTIIMFNNKFKKNIFHNLLIGIFVSVLIYYISHFSNVLGANGKLPVILSVWFPIIVIFIISLIGTVRLNEK